jgi:hypothetical protein
VSSVAYHIVFEFSTAGDAILAPHDQNNPLPPDIHDDPDKGGIFLAPLIYNYLTTHGWICHVLLGWKFEALPNIILSIPCNILWVVIRLLVMVLIVLKILLCQLSLFLLGIFLHSTALMTARQIRVWFWNLWSPRRYGVVEDTALTRVDDTSYNYFVSLEAVCEALPQLAIQALNNSQTKQWTTLARISIVASALQLLSLGYHFGQDFFRQDGPYRFDNASRYDLVGSTLEGLGLSEVFQNIYVECRRAYADIYRAIRGEDGEIEMNNAV